MRIRQLNFSRRIRLWYSIKKQISLFIVAIDSLRFVISAMYTNITMTCFYHAKYIACLCYIPINHARVYRFFILRMFLLSPKKKILQNALHKVLWKETYRVFYTIIYVYIYKSVYIYDDAVCNWQSRILYWFI